MNLTNLRISHKIIVLMAGLTLGFIAIGVTYYIQVTIDSNNRDVERGLLTFQQQLADANRDQLRLRESATGVLTLRDESHLQEYNRLHARLTANLQTLREQGANYGVDDAIVELSQSLTAYDQRFTDATARLQDASQVNSFAELERLAMVLEKQLQQINFTEGMVTFLQMHLQLRQYENQLQANALNANPAEFDMGFDSEWESKSRALHAALVQWVSSGSAAELSEDQRQQLLNNANAYTSEFRELASALNETAAYRSALNGDGEKLGAMFNQLLAEVGTIAAASLSATTERTQMIQAIVAAIIFSVAMGTAIGIYFIYKSIVFPMAHMQSVIRRINRGKTHARVKQISDDELGDLGAAFNKLLDERIQQLEDQSHENDQLNNSIIDLIQALGTIAKKDLTIKVPVSPDITGTISDAVNLLTTETARTLHQVKDISEEVNSISEQLHDQSTIVLGLADDERRHVIATSNALEVAARAMNDIAQRAGTADTLAQQAITSTRSARSTVVETVKGIRTIRETISETEKRMKRLGDRSQEISSIVNLINTISERTHILALNASMHAASAGEAGKGFAVVADEVQRLAENAREATAEISSMVNNIRVETSDTVTIMNTLITQVADGSRLAELAGERMDDTEQATTELVETVKVISENSSQQADIANKVRDRSTIIRRFTEKTGKQLAEQKRFTDSLKFYAATLVDRVNVFTLPDSARSAIELVPVAPTPAALPHDTELDEQTVA